MMARGSSIVRNLLEDVHGSTQHAADRVVQLAQKHREVLGDFLRNTDTRVFNQKETDGHLPESLFA